MLPTTCPPPISDNRTGNRIQPGSGSGSGARNKENTQYHPEILLFEKWPDGRPTALPARTQYRSTNKDLLLRAEVLF